MCCHADGPRGGKLGRRDFFGKEDGFIAKIKNYIIIQVFDLIDSEARLEAACVSP